MKEFIVAVFIVIFLFSGCATSSKQMDLEMQRLRTQIRTLEQQLKETEEEIEDLEIQLERERQRRSNLERQVAVKKMQLKETQSLPHPSVRNIQEALRRAGFYAGRVDGKFGPQTREAIKNFQTSKGLKVDGIVGKATWRELSKYLTERQK